MNSVVFQQVSLAAAMAAVRRLVLRFADPVELAGQRLYPFPRAEAVASVPLRSLRALGLSGVKADALRTCARMIKGALVTPSTWRACSHIGRVTGLDLEPRPLFLKPLS